MRAAGIAALVCVLFVPARAEAHRPPEWARNAVFYGVVVERFGDGDFDSLRRRLDRLDRLGIGAIWLSPVNSTLPDDFGYAVTDLRRLRNAYGTKADFRRLVDAAHRRGIRVIMDLVANHTSRAHRWFRRARSRGPESRWWDFYERGPGGRPRHYFDWRQLPNLNYDNPSVRRRIISASRYWVREFGIDGYRVDAAWGVRRRAPGFWPRWTRAMRRVDREVFLIAEASARRPYYLRNGFDAAYDWTEELGVPAWQQAFARRRRIGPRIESALRAAPGPGRGEGQVLRFLNNNDTGARFVSRYGVGMTRAATALLLTAPGIPVLYSGDEVGAEFDPYSLAEPIDFADRYRLRAFHRRLIRTRATLASLGGGRWVRVWQGPGDTYAFVRPPRHGAPPALVAINFAGTRRSVALRGGGPLAPFTDGNPLRDLLHGGTLEPLEPASPAVSLRAHEARIIVPQP
jgi:glycosidase